MKNTETPKKPRRANGDGTIKERADGRFEFRVVVGMAADGSYIRKSFYGKNPTAAKNAYKKYLKDNPIPLEKVKTLKEWAENWLLLYKKGKVSDGTYYEYELIVKRVILPVIGYLKLTEVRPAHIEKLMRSVDSVSSSRQKKVAFIIKAIFEEALENHYAKENPARKVKAPKMVVKDIEIYKPSEIEKIFAQEDPFRMFVILFFLTGMRCGELLALSWRNVDFKENVIHVRQALSDGEIKDKTKGKKDRIIPIYTELKLALEAIPKTGFTVITTDGIHPMTSDQFNYRYRKFIESTGVEFKSVHKCRHSFVTYMLKSGVPVHIVQAIAGHADMAMTEKYTHVNTDDLKDNIVKLKF